MKKVLREINLFLLYFGIIFYLEIVFRILSGGQIFNIYLINIIIFDLFLSLLLGVFTRLFGQKINRKIYFFILFMICLIFAVNLCVYKIFGFYFDLSLLGALDQVAEFATDGVKLVVDNILGVVLIFFPFGISICLRKKINIYRNNWKQCLVYIVITLLIFLLFNLSLNIKKNDDYSPYNLYHNVHNIELSIKKLGVMNAFVVDASRVIFGFDEMLVIESVGPIYKEESEPTEIKYDYNNLDIDFDSLISSTNNETLKSMHQYFKSESGTLQNEYTSYFKDKNLILFMAESFNEITVSEELTPTLYKLVNEGFVFKDFYTPTISSTIGGEFQELTGLVAASGFLTPWKDGKNSYPYGIANVFKNLDYSTYAYHNHNYTFQNRYKYLKAIGFDNFLGCRNGLETKINCKLWPESDVELIDVTTSDFLGSDKPFFTYYVTVSGHGDYGWGSSAMARKHKNEVIDLGYSEKVLAYLAANIELDKALELLLEKLEAAGKLDDTVIALVGDHYPYFLTTEEVNEISSYEKDSVVEINHSNFILWNSEMDTVEVEKVGSQIDVIPTLYNLFGIKYDSRLIIGKDILSTEPGLAIFGNRSWVSDSGTYFASSNEFVAKEGAKVSDEYVSNMNKIVSNKITMSKLIMTENYYKYIK